MLIWQAIVLGIVQGLTEFLPVSSSGHLELTKAMLSIRLGREELLFDLVLHAGTLVSVLIAYRRQLKNLLRKPCKQWGWLCIATLPAAIAGLFLNDFLEERFLNGRCVGICFLITATLLFFCERKMQAQKPQKMSLKHAAIMGAAQAFAVLPGISRSGSTIVGGIFAGADREEATDFSFLMSLPIIGGSLAYRTISLIVHGEKLSQAAQAFGSAQNTVCCLLLGIASAAVVGLFAIRFLRFAVRKGGFTGFSVYLVFAAVSSFLLYAYGIFA